MFVFRTYISTEKNSISMRTIEVRQGNPVIQAVLRKLVRPNYLQSDCLKDNESKFRYRRKFKLCNPTVLLV